MNNNISSNKSKWTDLFSDGNSIYTTTILIGILLHAMDAFIVSTLMPTIVADLGKAEFYSWVLMLYMTTSIIGSACTGIIRNTFGARKAYIIASMTFLIGTLIAGTSSSMFSLLFGRIIAGFGAGLIIAQNTSLISQVFTESLRARIIALLSIVWAIAAMTGPLIGGIFAEINFWRGGFLFALPIIIFFTYTAMKAIPKEDKKYIQIQFPFIRILLLGSGVLLIGFSGVASLIVLKFLSLIIGILFLIISINIDSSKKSIGLFPKNPFSIKSANGTANWFFLLISIPPVALGIYMPLAYQMVYDLKPLLAGYLSALLAVFWSIAAAAVSNFSIKFQSYALILGPLISFCGLLGIAIGIGNFSWQVLACFTAITGTGIGVCMGHLMNWTMTLAKSGEERITASSIQTIRSLGIALGAAGSGLIANLSGLKDSFDAKTVVKAITHVEIIASIAPTLTIFLAIVLIWHRSQYKKTV